MTLRLLWMRFRQELAEPEKLFAYELYDLKPDIVTMAKGLGGGVPIGAFCANEKFLLQRLNLVTMEPLSEETPLSTRAGLVVLDELIHGGVLENVGETGSYLFDKLRQLADANSKLQMCAAAD